ncbi:MAG: 50S ribosomal protein L10 [Clostridia bacterium]|nr:50S ribosomal protein L10 [Clostridiales bacterium]MDE5601620.1 50S ribosomal protein L10 [Clostridia bacterium]
MNQQVLEAKKQQVEEIKAKIQSAKSIVLIDYMGLTVAQDTAFRKELRENGVDYGVLKNRLVKIAFNELGYTQFDEALNGPTAVAFSSTDAVAPAKYIVKNIKALNKMKTKCGMVEGEFMDEAGLKQIAEIPSKDVLLAKMLGSMQSPISKLARCLSMIAEGKSAQA